MLFTSSSPLACGLVNLSVSTRDQAILRTLAGRLAECAAHPREDDKRRLWLAHNALASTRPLVFCDPENGWHEIFPDHSLSCEGELARMWEFTLRKDLFWAECLGDDRVAQALFEVAHVYTCSGWGIDVPQIGGEHGGAYRWDSPITSAAGVDRLRTPSIEVDETATARVLDLANITFDGLLTVRLCTRWWWSLGLTWNLAGLRGLGQMMVDMIDQPDLIHRMMAILRDGTHSVLDQLEAKGLLSLNQAGDYVGSGGFGWTHELPQPDYAGHVRCCDLWGFAESQETVGISPSMFEEFVFPYQLTLLARFGFNCYGCCEPLDKRWHIVQNIPHLRRVSVSPWSNRSYMAEMLGDRYILSMKPNPAGLAAPEFDEDDIRRTLRQDLRATRDCRVEVIMKDNHTIANDPRRVIRWVQIAREEAACLGC